MNKSRLTALLPPAASRAGAAHAQTAPAPTSVEPLIPAVGTVLDVSAEGRTTRVPDLATIRAGVVSQGPTAAAALSDNAARMQRVLAAVKRAGVADRDIQTATVQLQPQYRYGENVPPVITGYQATNTLSIRFRDIAKSGSVLDALVAQGANQIDGPNLSLDNPDAALDEARADAVKRARARAEPYSNAAGMEEARQEVEGLLIRRLEALDLAGALIVGRATDQHRLGDTVAGDRAVGQRLIEEVLHRLVEDVERQLTDAGEIPFDGGVELPCGRGLQIGIARRRRDLAAIGVKAELQEVADVRKVRTRHHLRRRQAQHHVTTQTELQVHAGQPVVILVARRVGRGGSGRELLDRIVAGLAELADALRHGEQRRTILQDRLAILGHRLRGAARCERIARTRLVGGRRTDLAGRRQVGQDIADADIAAHADAREQIARRGEIHLRVQVLVLLRHVLNFGRQIRGSGHDAGPLPGRREDGRRAGIGERQIAGGVRLRLGLARVQRGGDRAGACRFAHAPLPDLADRIEAPEMSTAPVPHMLRPEAGWRGL